MMSEFNTSCVQSDPFYSNNEAHLFILCCIAFVGILIIIYIRKSRFNKYEYEHMSTNSENSIIPDNDNCFVSKSQIQNAGYGLWAKTNIKKGEPIVQYEGIYHNSDEYNYETECEGDNCYNYLFCNDNDCWDAKDNTEFIARYSNDCHNSDFECNASYDMINGNPYIVASSDIPEGDEIFTTYGNMYWTNK